MALEQELRPLRQALLLPGKGGRRTVSLAGIGKGVEVSEKDIEEAKATLFPSRH